MIFQKPGQPDLIGETANLSAKRHKNALPVIMHTVVMTNESNSIIATGAKALEYGQDREFHDGDAPDNTLPRLLMKPKIGIIRKHWQSTHRQQTTTPVFRPQGGRPG